MQSTVNQPSSGRRQYMPNPHLIFSIRNQNLPWWKALAELIDNAFDHGATRVVISCGRRVVEVNDDGNGIKDVASAVTLGDHRPSKTTTLGMYGVGLKDAWLSAGDKIEISTTHRGVLSELSLDVNELDDAWYGPEPTTSETDAANGTTIRLHLRPTRNMPQPEVWQTLSWAFTPALNAGKQIVQQSRKKKTLVAAALPPMSKRVVESFEVSGKTAAIDIGIVHNDAKMDRGPFWVIYGHRILRSASIGVKSYSTLRVGGTITLGKGWAVTKNKDDLAEYSTELDDAIFTRIEPLLREAEKLTEDIEADALKSELETMINHAVDDAKREARASTRESVGTVEPVATARRRKRASKVSDLPGAIAGTGKRRRGFSLGWCYLEAELLGRYEGLSNRVDLNLEHPFVATSKRANNAAALYTIAVAIIADYACRNLDGEKTLFDVQDFGQCFGRIMKTVRIKDGNGK